ncbi:hypothetical protein B0T21DRAFT_292466 [Apiosordaria backusii]|uniref:Uncharacterized protein n=1 Tax=Apiosordaria backusii TaxID=314023 RepID=A0AA40B851_9PEZI|nr:hypothetical protein B0T21DRAFT_292466 [Apiosordaria backusii]
MSNRPPAEKPGPVPTVKAAPTTTASFGVLTTSDSNVPDASSGPHRDGRIRNPVPSKLKGKTDGSKGNFSVMHMDVAGRTEATERDAEAKRTSESTELAAKRAFENGYVSLRRSRFIHIPDEPELVAKPLVPPPAPVSAVAHRTRQTPLSPEETKAEQARLLTLLRSLHPVLVVDQICKALAFFGGIPGGPPPTDGFPQSAESNGPGSLFVGWIAEIFPRLGGNTGGQQPVSPAVRQPDPPPPVSTRRKRGRPKGSKGTRPRVDKGIKKGPLLKSAAGAYSQQPANAADESWVDVEEDAVDEVDANVMLLAQNTTPQPQQSGSALERPLLAASTPVRTTLPTAPITSASTIDLTASTKRRGRPKGSKNRPKDGSSDTSATARNGNLVYPRPPDVMAQTTQALPQPAQASSTPRVSDNTAPSQAFTPVNASTPSSAAKKVGRSKASGSKQRPPGQPSHGPLGPGNGIPGGEGAPTEAAAVIGSGTGSGVVMGAGPGTTSGAGAKSGLGLTRATETGPGGAVGGPGDATTTGIGTDLANREPVTSPQGVESGLGNFATTDFVYSVPPASSSAASTQRARPRASQTSRPAQNAQGQTLALPTPPSASPALSNVAPGGSGQKRKRITKAGADNNTARSGVSSQESRMTSSPQINGPALPTPPAHIGSGPSTAAPALQPPPAKRSRKGKSPKQSTATASQASAAANVDEPAADNSPALSSSAAAALSLTTRAESSHNMASVSSEASVPPIHSPHQSHYEVQSPTMENYEAQLQAQLEQQAEMESQAMSHQSPVEPAQYMSTRIQRQRQQQQQQQQQSVSAPHHRSPIAQPQTSNPQAALSLAAQSQSRTTTQNPYPQYRTPNSQYSQLQHSKQNHSSSQSLSSSQPQQQQHQQSSSQFLGQQKSHGQTVQASSAQQYSTNTTQQQQYPSNQQSYTNKQQQHSSQQRYQQQQLATSAASTTSYNNARQSSQFGGSASSSYTATAENTYRGSSASLGAAAYGQRSQSATPSTAASFRSSSTHGLPHHSPSFSTSSSTVQQRSGSASHATNQSVQGMPSSMQAFSGNTGSSWDLFDTSHMDTSGQQSALGLANPNYGINARTSSNSATFGAGGLGNYDTSGLPYGVGRR